MHKGHYHGPVLSYGTLDDEANSNKVAIQNIIPLLVFPCLTKGFYKLKEFGMRADTSKLVLKLTVFTARTTRP